MNFEVTNMKNKLICWVIAVWILMTGTVSIADVGSVAGGMPADIVVVIDDTRSMIENDPQKLAATAVSEIADQLLPNDNIWLGMAVYDLDVDTASLPLGSYNNSDIKSFAASILQDGKGTDAAIGLNWAVNELETKGRSGSAKAIIIVGDGENSFVRDNVMVRTDAESDAMRDAAVNTAINKGYKIYSLAINPTDEKFKNYFIDLSEKTGGLFKAPTSESIKSDIKDIINTITNTNVGPNGSKELQPSEKVVSEYEVEPNTFQLNALVDHTEAVDIKFIDPDGNILGEDGENGILSDGDGYTNFKAIMPKAGVWKVEFINTAAVSQVVSWQITSMSDLSNESVLTEKDGKIILQSRLLLNNNYITDPAVLSKIKGAAIVQEKGQSSSDSYEMSVVGDLFETTLPLENGKEYDITSKLEMGTSVFVKNISYPADITMIDDNQSQKNADDSVSINSNSEKKNIITPIIFIIVAVLLAVILVIIIKKLIDKKRNDTLIPFNKNIRVRLTYESSHGTDRLNERSYVNVGTIFTSVGQSTMSNLMNKYKSNELAAVGGLSVGRTKIKRVFNASFSNIISGITFRQNKGDKIWIEFADPNNDDSFGMTEITVNSNKILKYPEEVTMLCGNDNEICLLLHDGTKYIFDITFEEPNGTGYSF